jgi:hypothetical protein
VDKMNVVEENTNVTQQKNEKRNAEQPITSNSEQKKASWFKIIFLSIGNFLNKIFNTILSMVKKTSISETVEINDDFINELNKETDAEKNQQVVEQDMENLSEDKLAKQEIIEPLEINQMSHNQTNAEAIQEDQLPEALTEELTEEVPEEPTEEVPEEPTEEVPEEPTEEVPEEPTEEVPEEPTEELIEMPAEENMNKPPSKVNFVPCKVNSYETLQDSIIKISDAIILDVEIPLVPEDKSDVIILKNQNEKISFSISDTSEYAQGIQATVQSVSDGLNIPQDVAEHIIKQLQENEKLVRKHISEVRISMINNEIKSEKLKTREDMVEMALRCLNTPDPKKAKIEEIDNEVFFVFPQESSNSDPCRMVMCEEIKINLNNFDITKSIEYYNFMNYRNEYENTPMTKEELSSVLFTIYNVLKDNKDFIEKEFFKPNEDRVKNVDYQEADEILGENKPYKQKNTMRDKRTDYEKQIKFEDDLASGKALETKEQKRQKTKTRYVPKNNNDDIEY